MITSQELTVAATSHISDTELRSLIDCELDEADFETSDIRLALAADLLCDAALEVMVQISKKPSITKIVALDADTDLELPEMAIYKDLYRSFQEKKVTHEELQALLPRGSVADVIQDMLEAGESPEDIADATICIASVRLAELLKGQTKPKGILGRIFGRI